MDHDIVLFGATGFTGKLVAEYLASHPSRTSFSWAIAGRSSEKLVALQSSLAGAASEIIVADTADKPSIDAMVSKARVVITTAGPYGEYGGGVVVETCARQGRHYVRIPGQGDHHSEVKVIRIPG